MPLHAPHRHIKSRDAKEQFLLALFDSLWARYRERNEYVQTYEELVAARRATFVNDHIAFRTLAHQRPQTGIAQVSRPLETLGYAPAACYEFPDKSLSSIHYRHPRPDFPKIFITQLKTWECSDAARRIFSKTLSTHRPPLPDRTLSALRGLAKPSAPLLKALTRHFEELPWDLPRKEDVLALDKETQFGAWVLVNGYDVNHFTASVDSHGVKSLDDIEKVQAAMIKEGIPMKKEIEGERGSKLRQTSTEAVVIPTPVKDGGKTVRIPWTYAYFEIIQRPLLKNPATGKKERFEGFLGGQATNLFEMTRRAVK